MQKCLDNKELSKKLVDNFSKKYEKDNKIIVNVKTKITQIKINSTIKL
jgi:hypothetical protein